MGFADLIVGMVMLSLIYVFAGSSARSRYGGTPLLQHYNRALFLKLFGAILLGFIYFFYYSKGDTLFYFSKAKMINEAFLRDPSNNYILYFPEFFESEILNLPAFQTELIRKPSSYMVMRIAAFFGLFTFNTYTGIAIFFGLLSFSGIWRLYLIFYENYPGLHKDLAWAFLYIPSLVLWGSGILKDALTLGFMAWVIYTVYQIVIKRKIKISYFFILIFAVYVIATVKAYILMALLPALVFFAINTYRLRIKSRFVANTMIPIVFFLAAVLSLLLINNLSSIFVNYNVENIEQRAEGFQRWHTVRSEATDGSGYTLGEMESGLGGMVKKFPLAVNVTLFRPYVWEVKNPLMLMSALESLFIFLFFLRVLFESGTKVFGLMLYDPLVSFSIAFALVFAFAVGVTSFNFGALVRYKIPCIPFFVASLYILRYMKTGKPMNT